MSFNWKAAIANVAAVAILALVISVYSFDGRTVTTTAYAAGANYQFELAGQPKKTGAGVSVVSVRLLHSPDKKPVPKAVIIETRADMGPDGMGMMAVPVKALPESEPGIYPFEITFGSMWNKPGNWALSLAARVQGDTETARGSVTVHLEP